MNFSKRAFRVSSLVVCSVALAAATALAAPRINVYSDRLQQEFQGLGCGAIFFEGHATSLGANGKTGRQQQLYDDMFKKAPTRFLQLMIRPDHEPQNDNADPYTPAFDPKNFAYCKATLEIAKAARLRQPGIQLFATLYTPPPWMKTNNDQSGGGEKRATLKPDLQLECAEYMWAFLAYMARNGAPVQYLSISNECDWPHTQPSYFLKPDDYAALFKTVAEYLNVMARKFPDVPRPKLVGPNTLSAVGAARDYLPPLLAKAGQYVDVVAAHDYDPRGDRWGDLRKIIGPRPLWMSEWSVNHPDPSQGLINAGVQYGVAMCDAFNGGVNVWQAYDWVYPLTDGGEALIQVDWGKDYVLKKTYWVFRQWAESLLPGMRVARTEITGDGAGEIKTVAFVAPDRRGLIVEAVNPQDHPVTVNLNLTGWFADVPALGRSRTSVSEDAVILPPLYRTLQGFNDTLPARSALSYRVRR